MRVNAERARAVRECGISARMAELYAGRAERARRALDYRAAAGFAGAAKRAARDCAEYREIFFRTVGRGRVFDAELAILDRAAGAIALAIAPGNK